MYEQVESYHKTEPNLFSLDRRGDLDPDRDLEFDLDLDREVELLERDLEPLSDREERLLDLDDEDDDDEVLSLRRFLLLGGDCDLDLERLQKNTHKQKPRCTLLMTEDGLKCATLLRNIFQQCS